MTPFAGFKDFPDCVKKNSYVDDPFAYCGSIYWRAEGAKLVKVKRHKRIKGRKKR